MSHNTYLLFQVLIHKICIKEWELEKDNILSLIPFDDEKFKTKEINYTDFTSVYSDEMEKMYQVKFSSLVKPYIEEFGKTSDYKFTSMSKVWCQRYNKNDYHAPHDHGANGYSAVFYAQIDSEVHPSTKFFSPFMGLDGGHERDQSIMVDEGDLVIFPSNILHMAPPHYSDKERIIMSFNLV
tara:strand:+ start:48 stop:593 length:546 start_codon:yes stop_codon:yes gene_type:complete